MNISLPHSGNRFAGKHVRGLAISVAGAALTLGAIAGVSGSFDRAVPSQAQPAVPNMERSSSMPAARPAITYYLVDTQVEADRLTSMAPKEAAETMRVVIAGSADAALVIDGASAAWGDYALPLVDLRTRK